MKIIGHLKKNESWKGWTFRKRDWSGWKAILWPDTSFGDNIDKWNSFHKEHVTKIPVVRCELEFVKRNQYSLNKSLRVVGTDFFLNFESQELIELLEQIALDPRRIARGNGRIHVTLTFRKQSNNLWPRLFNDDDQLIRIDP